MPSDASPTSSPIDASIAVASAEVATTDDAGTVVHPLAKPAPFTVDAELTLGPGDVVRLAAGTETVWTVTETLRKVYFS